MSKKIKLLGKEFGAEDLNLDSMSPDELMEFWRIHHSGVAVKLFPQKPKGYILAVRRLGFYAYYKAQAINLRRNGDIPEALKREAVCERVYKDIPEFARW